MVMKDHRMVASPPQKVEFHSQRDILTSNRKKRADVLSALEELRKSQSQVAPSIEIRKANS